MKKVTIGIMLLTSGLAFAQQVAMPSVGTETMSKKGKMVNSLNPASLHKPTTNLGSYHFVWGYAENIYQYQTTFQGVPAANLGIYLNPIFMDSTTSSSAPTASGGVGQINDMRAGVMFDPTSAVYDTTSWKKSVVTKGQSYTIDTILIAGSYHIVKNNAHPDTLYVEMVWGAHNSTSWQPLQSIASPKEYWVAPHVTDSKLNGNVSHVTGALKNTIKRVLTAADTVTMSGKYPGFIVVKVNQLIPAGDIVSASCVFVPGTATPYTQGTVDFAYAGAPIPATQNGFGVTLFGDASATPTANYFYDSTATAGHYSYNSGLFYSPVDRYRNEPAAYALFDTLLGPSSNYAWQIDFAFTLSPTGINENVANELKVSQNIPNPFSSVTLINYELAENTSVSLDVFDITGQKVQTIEQGKQDAGTHAIQLNSANLQAGVYFYTLTAGVNRITKRMVIVK